MLIGHASILALLLALPAFATDATDDEETVLVAATQAVLDAQIRFDVPALDALLAPDYLEISPIGDVDTRADVLGFYSPEAKAKMQAGGMKAISAMLSDPHVRIDGEHADVIALDTARLEIGGAPQQRALRIVFRFRRIDGAWRLQSAAFIPYRPQPKA